MNSSTALVPYVASDVRERALAWSLLPADERRRRAMDAASRHDVNALCDVLCAYLLVKSRQHQAISSHTLTSYLASCRQLCSAWQEENLLHPSRDAGDRFVGQLSRRLSPASVATRLAGAKALYRALRWVRATDANPFDDVYAPRDRTPAWEKRQAYPQEDIAALLANAGRESRLFVLLCAHGGLRVSEALALEWPDVAEGFRSLRIRHGKGDKERTVYCSSSLRTALEAAHRMRRYGPVLASSWGQSYRDPKPWRRQLAHLCQIAGVPYRGIHALRHSAATRLVAETGNIHMTAAHLGHSDVNATAIYAKMADTQLQTQLESW